MKGGEFELTLASPHPPEGSERFRSELEFVSDRYVGWPSRRRNALHPFLRMRHVFSGLPIPVATDRDTLGARVVRRELDRVPDVVVFDFPHSAVLAPDTIPCPSVMFTHNIETEIFRRHAQVTTNPIKRWIWTNQLKKMEAYEKHTLDRFDAVIAVSERDGAYFRSAYGIDNVSVIRTGVDLDYFSYTPPPDRGGVVFTGSMDWFANVDAIEFFIDEIWPELLRHDAGLTMSVVGRSPPAALISRSKAAGGRLEFTGFVDDVRPHVRRAQVYAIPLRVGGGTRIKVFEAMAMGCPVVSTSIGVEGLPLEDGKHFLLADNPSDFARALLRLLGDHELRMRLSRDARAHIERHFSNTEVAREFEKICRSVSSDVPRTPDTATKSLDGVGISGGAR